MTEKLPETMYYWKNSSRSRPYATKAHLKSGIRARYWVTNGRIYVAKTVWEDVTDELIDENGRLK